MPPFCQKQLHVLLGILGVLVTEWSQRVNFCIIRGALHLLIMNRRTREMKSPQEWKSPGEASLPVAFGINYVSRPRPQRRKNHVLPQKQGFTDEELFIFGQYWSPGNSPTPPKSFHSSLHFFPDSALEFDDDHDQGSFFFHPFCSYWVGKCAKIPVAKHAYQALRSSLSNEMFMFICCGHLYPFLPRQPDVRG